MSDAIEFAAVALELVAAEVPVTSPLAMMRSRCDLGGPPEGCDTCHWRYRPGRASLLRRSDRRHRGGCNCTMMGTLHGVECYPRR